MHWCRRSFARAMLLVLLVGIRTLPTLAEETPLQRYVDAGVFIPTSTQEAVGYVAFVRDPLRVVFPSSLPRPEEIGTALKTVGVPGETRILTLHVRALRPLAELVVVPQALQGSDWTIPAQHITAQPVVYGVKQGQKLWGEFHADPMEVPLYLSSCATVNVEAMSTQSFGLQVTIPAEASPGTYQGVVTVQAADAGSVDVPLRVDVLPIALRPVEGYALGMHVLDIRAELKRNQYETIFRDMRYRGLNTVGLMVPLGETMTANWDEDGNVKVSVMWHWPGSGSLEMALDAYTRAGLTEPVVWLMYNDVLEFCRRRTEGKPAEVFSSCYEQVITSILERGKQRGWPEIVFQPVDEPFAFTQRMPDALATLPVLKSIPGVRTTEDGYGGMSNWAPVYPWLDVLTQYGGPHTDGGQYEALRWQDFLRQVHQDGKEVWIYNPDITGWHVEPMRFYFGFGLWHSGATGVLQWAYQNPSREGKYLQPSTFMYPPQPGHTGGPSLAYMAVSEGVGDLRYLLTLKALVDEAMVGPDLQKQMLARQAWAEVEQRLAVISHECRIRDVKGDWTGSTSFAPDGARLVSGELKMNNGLSFSDYDEMRKEIAHWIMRLQE